MSDHEKIGNLLSNIAKGPVVNMQELLLSRHGVAVSDGQAIADLLPTAAMHTVIPDGSGRSRHEKMADWIKDKLLSDTKESDGE